MRVDVDRTITNLSILQGPGCPQIGDDVDVDGVQFARGNVDCLNGVNIGDAQKIARSPINLSVRPGCPLIGQTT